MSTVLESAAWEGKCLTTCTYREIRSPASSGELGPVCGRAARVHRHLGKESDRIGQSSSLRGAP